MENIIEGKVKYRSVNTHGIQLEEFPNRWFNFKSKDEEHKKKIIEKVANLKPGSEIALVMDDDNYVEFTVIKEPEVKEDEGMIGLSELLNAAHKKHLANVVFEYKHIDYEKKEAHIVAHVVMGDRQQYMGSAYKRAEDMKGKQGNYWLETIESQALSRALRWATNYGELEEEQNGEGTERTENENREDIRQDAA